MGKRSKARRRLRRLATATLERKDVSVPATIPNRTVRVMRDDCLEYPDLYLFVYIHGPRWEQNAYADMFVKTSSTRVATPEEADLVVFVGGSDVNPILYDETRHETTHFSIDRDVSDIEMYQLCLEQGIPMLGVCRGLQFGHVMNGGKLFQDISGHQQDHSIWCTRDKQLIKGVSSVHHQAVMRDVPGMEVLAEIANSEKRWINAMEYDEGMTQIVEAAFYRDTCFLGVQGHPEYNGYNFYTHWVLKQIEDLIVFNPDIEMDKTKNVRRMKKDLINQRTQKWKDEGFVLPSLPSFGPSLEIA